MSNTPNEPSVTEEGKPSAVKRILPLVLAGSIGLFAGGAAGALVAGPAMAARAVAHAEVVAEEVVTKAVIEHAESGKGKKGGKGSHGEGKDGETVSAPVYKVENLVLNPAQSGGTRFLVASLALEVADSATTAAMQQRDSEVRDAVLRVLGAKTVVQLADMGARPTLKQELQAAVDSIFGEHSVSAVYFPQFVIQ